MTKEYLIDVFSKAIAVIPFDERETSNSFFVGQVSITEETGLEAMLEEYTAYIDSLIRDLPLTDAQLLELIISRGFTYQEYKSLWQLRAKDVPRSMICKVLVITNEEELRLFTTSVAGDDTHERFVEMLQTYTNNCNKFLHNLIYETYA